MKKEFIVERQGNTFVLYAGLLDEAHAQGLKSISTTLLQIPTEDNHHVAICQAVVETSKGVFSGIGDASPNNVARPMANVLIRMAETRAKARALRDAVNVGVAAFEELDGGDQQDNYDPRQQQQRARVVSTNGNGGIPAPSAPTIVSNTNALATDKQLQAIYSLAYKRLFMSEEELQARVQKTFGVPLEQLGRGDASQLIDTLKRDAA